jgi:hypothetical protein
MFIIRVELQSSPQPAMRTIIRPNCLSMCCVFCGVFCRFYAAIVVGFTANSAPTLPDVQTATNRAWPDGVRNCVVRNVRVVGDCVHDHKTDGEWATAPQLN